MPITVADRRNMVHSEVLPRLNLRPFIGGEFIDPGEATTLSTYDPMTQELLAELPLVGASVVENAVTAARVAFDDQRWSGLHPRERARYLYRLADLIERDQTKIALLESVDAGKRLSGVSAWDIPNAAEVYRYYAGWADKITGDYLPSSAGVQMYTRQEPVGVCAAIVSWNFPFPCIAWKIAPALAAGCTVIVKSPERAPLSAQYLAGLVSEAGFPDGVLNILCGDSATGKALVADPRVDKITFTGATATAEQILRATLSSPLTCLPRVVFELGDKTPNVICADADIEKASAAAVGATFGISGQNCCAGSRTLVDVAILDEVRERMILAARNRRLGDQLNDQTEQGPQIDQAHVERIHRHVQGAVAEGAEILTGGAPALAGRFFEPTLLTGTDNQLIIDREEVFGPVGTLIPFSGLDEAIRIANDRDYGLAAAIWTSNGAAADQFSRQVAAGTCWINCYEYFDSVAPWGGRKLSGVGKELGRDGIQEFLETKTVVKVELA